MKLSIIIPAHNEEASLQEFLPVLIKHVKKTVGSSYEIVIINDGSTDRTLEIIENAASANDNIRGINLSRNFGKEIALTAGIYHSMGDAAIMIDADGQHPPELIPEFYSLWKEGNQVVVGVRKSNKKEGIVKRYGSRLFYRMFNATSELTLIPGATDYRLIDRVVMEEFKQFTERFRITRGIIDWMGFKRALVPFHANERIAGQASYKISKLVGLALNSFISLSLAPLYAIGYVGAAITLLALLSGAFIFVEQIILNDPLGLAFTGTAMLSILIIFLVGILLTVQGLVSLYLSHIHAQTQNRPLFIVDKSHSVNL